jgi:hypothetical protein
LDGEKPDEQRLMEASGNEGASFERSYHRAALVLWRRKRYAEVLLQAGVEAALPYLQERIEACDGKQSSPKARKEAVTLARQLVKAWKSAPDYASYSHPARPEKRDVMLRRLVQLGDAAVVEEFVNEVVTRDYDGSENAALVACAGLLGAGATGRLYAELARRQTPIQHGPCVELLRALASTRETSKKPEWLEALREISKAAVGKLVEVGNQRREHEWMKYRVTEKAPPVNAALVANLLNVLGELRASALRAEAVKQVAARPAVFEPVTILVPALALVEKLDAAVKQLWQHSVEFLWQRSGRPPEAPSDWRQEVKLSCACADCRELQAFTLDGVEQTHRFRVKKERRQHLHRQIEKHSLDMTHVTDRRGSPQTLVCTKDRRSYRRRCAQYLEDIAALASLAEQAGKSSIENKDALQRIAAARALAKEWSPG